MPMKCICRGFIGNKYGRQGRKLNWHLEIANSFKSLEEMKVIWEAFYARSSKVTCTTDHYDSIDICRTDKIATYVPGPG